MKNNLNELQQKRLNKFFYRISFFICFIGVAFFTNNLISTACACDQEMSKLGSYYKNECATCELSKDICNVIGYVPYLHAPKDELKKKYGEKYCWDKNESS